MHVKKIAQKRFHMIINKNPKKNIQKVNRQTSKNRYTFLN